MDNGNKVNIQLAIDTLNKYKKIIITNIYMKLQNTQKIVMIPSLIATLNVVFRIIQIMLPSQTNAKINGEVVPNSELTI